METVVVGDIHGKLEVTKKFLSMADDNTRVVFVGDYLDSFTESPDDQVECLLAVLQAMTSGKNVLALKGNHEISYLNPRQVCSGWKQVTQCLIDSVGKAYIEDNLLEYVWIEGGDTPILISHGGVSALHFPKDPQDISVRDVEEWLLHSNNVAGVGRARGGYQEIGGIFWCDWWREFEPVPAIRQIVGHSSARPRGAYEGVVTNGDNYNIDCLDRVNEYLVIDDSGAIRVETL